MSDILGSVATTTTLAVGTSLSSRIDFAGDRDWVRVNLVAGQTYSFAMGNGTLQDSFLTLRNGSGVAIASDDDSGPGLDSLIRYTATTSGTYFLDASAYSSFMTGSYTLSANAGVAPLTPTYSNDQIAEYLATRYWTASGGAQHRWTTSTITYNVTGLTAEGQVLARAAFASWAEVAPLNFVETTGVGMIRLDDAASGAYATANYSNGVTTSAFVNVSTAWLATYGTDLRSYSYQTYIHEIGHVLGLGHAGPYNGSATYGVDNAYRNDSWQATVMSYFHQDENTAVDASFAFVVTPQVADILAMRALYGAANVRGGDTTYGFNSNAGTVFDADRFGSDAAQPINVSYTITDSGGTDILDYSGYVRDQRIDLRAESASSIGGEVGNVAIARGTVIEHAFGGSGNDTLIGNAVGNALSGGAGGDLLLGLGGADYIVGGDGFDAAGVDGLRGAGHDIVARGGTVYTMQRSSGWVDTNLQVERFVQIGGPGQVDRAQIADFDALAYAASDDDLTFAFRIDEGAAFDHYLRSGFQERREISFEATQYLANYADLRSGFGGDTAAATRHFLQSGVDEHRLAEDPLDYVASYADLIGAFGGQSQAGLAASGLGHYSASGQAEGRRGGITFDAGQYLSNYADLGAAFGGNGDAAAVHYINDGYREHRLDADPFAYVASYADLLRAFVGAGVEGIRAAALSHYAAYGFGEGRRAGIDFDAEQYLANYTDLRAAFVLSDGRYDEDAAARHFVLSGFAEGRTDALI